MQVLWSPSTAYKAWLQWLNWESGTDGPCILDMENLICILDQPAITSLATKPIIAAIKFSFLLSTCMRGPVHLSLCFTLVEASSIWPAPHNISEMLTPLDHFDFEFDWFYYYLNILGLPFENSAVPFQPQVPYYCIKQMLLKNDGN